MFPLPSFVEWGRCNAVADPPAALGYEACCRNGAEPALPPFLPAVELIGFMMTPIPGPVSRLVKVFLCEPRTGLEPAGDSRALPMREY